MGQILEMVPKLNTEVLTAKPPIAKEIIQIAAALGSQSATEMNANFTAISTAALTVLTKKLAEAAAELNIPLVASCTAAIATVQANMVVNDTNTVEFLGELTPFSE